jgi:serine/threonine protein kinase
MVSIDGTCKIIDFGIARYLADAGRPMTGGVCTRWYKPPEIAFGAKHYGFTVDVWSLGCILAELYMKEPIFRGEGAIDQLSRIFGIRGTPNVKFSPFFKNKIGKHLARSD